jgi:ABC-type phosphate transport system substrate-binding protein
MKLKLVSVAVLGAFAAAPALALLPSIPGASDTVIRFSGSTSQNNQINSFMRRACVPGTLDRYRRTSNNSLYICNPDAGTGLSSADKLFVYKDGDGGSGNGVQPVANGTALTFMNVGTLNTASQCGDPIAVPSVSVSGHPLGLPAYTEWSCAAHTEVNAVPDAGVSDVEPALLGATATELAALAITPTNALMFGTPVTLGLRNALQTKQIADGDLPAACTAGNESLECMPSLTKSQVTALFTGAITTWSTLGLAPADDNVYVAGRVRTAGALVAARVFFLNDPCASGMSGFVDSGNTNPTGDAVSRCATPGTQTTFNMNGSGDVVSCMASHNTAGRFAIGVLSTENVGAGHRFVKIDGAEPTVYGAAKNRYQFVMEATAQRRTALSGNALTFFNAFLSSGGGWHYVPWGQSYATPPIGLQDPVAIKPINTGFAHNFCTTNGPSTTAPGAGCTGLLATALSGFEPPAAPFTAAQVINNPVMTAAKSVSGAPNNCQPLQPVWPH